MLTAALFTDYSPLSNTYSLFSGRNFNCYEIVLQISRCMWIFGWNKWLQKSKISERLVCVSVLYSLIHNIGECSAIGTFSSTSSTAKLILNLVMIHLWCLYFLLVVKHSLTLTSFFSFKIPWITFATFGNLFYVHKERITATSCLPFRNSSLLLQIHMNYDVYPHAFMHDEHLSTMSTMLIYSLTI